MAGNRFEDAASVWDERYGTSEFVFGIEPNSYLAKQASLLKAGQRALLIADGEGRNSVWPGRQGLRVNAFDISSAGVGMARRLATGPMLRTVFASLKNFVGMVARKPASHHSF